jgi:EmrB/QacA subfamily drug resistance transporter
MKLNERYDLILVVVCLAAFMGSLDVSAVLIALPSISDHFNVTTSVSTWIIMSYGLIMASFMLIFGKLGDRLGFRSIILAGFIIFTVSSLMCGLATNIVDLIIYRAVQGVGAAMLAALGPAIVSTYFPSARRGVGLGYVTTFASLGLAVGPVVGGLLIQHFDWRWIFLVNVPVGLIGLALAFLVVPQVVVDRHKPFDIVGSVLVFLALICIVFSFNMGEELEWDSPVIWSSGLAGIALLLLFTRHLKRTKDPLLDVNLMRNPNIRWGNWSSLVVLAAASGAFVLLPFYFQYVKCGASRASASPCWCCHWRWSSPARWLATCPTAGGAGRSAWRLVRSLG